MKTHKNISKLATPLLLNVGHTFKVIVVGRFREKIANRVFLLPLMFLPRLLSVERDVVPRDTRGSSLAREV